MVCHKRFSSSRTSRRYFLTVITKRAYLFVNTAQNPNDDCFFTSCHDLVIHVRRRQLALFVRQDICWIPVTYAGNENSNNCTVHTVNASIAPTHDIKADERASSAFVTNASANISELGLSIKRSHKQVKLS